MISKDRAGARDNDSFIYVIRQIYTESARKRLRDQFEKLFYFF